MSGLPSYAAIVQELLSRTGGVSELETVSLASADGRYLSADVAALAPLPAYDHAVMDGYALGALPPGAYQLRTPSQEPLAIDQAQRVRTGEAIPPGSRAVVMRDHAMLDGDSVIADRSARKTNIRLAGEEAKAGAVVLEAGTKLDARHLAMAAMTGHRTLPVWKPAPVKLLALHDAPTPLPHLDLFDALLRSPALALDSIGIVRAAALEGTLDRLRSAQGLLVVVAESLDGEDGPLAMALQKMGTEARIHRAALKPAKPIIEAQLGDLRIIGLSGTAYACLVAAHLFLRPVLAKMVGAAISPPTPTRLGFDRQREPGRAEALPVRLSNLPELTAESAGRFGQLSAVANMDGFVLVPAESADLKQGDRVSYWPVQMPLV
jgi:molybdopterin molybdotransferase